MADTEKSAEFMLLAINEAKKGEGFTHPNPLVGAVLVKDGIVLATGYHHRYGDLHAERDCLKNAREKGVDTKGATMYVTLEPCCHTGKQPPCTNAIIEAGIARVVIGSRDPNNLVNGKGVEQLKAAGIEVVQDFLKEECDKLNEVFFYYITHKMPYVILKYAMTADGRTATVSGKSKWITGEKARENVHRTRASVAAVMTGIGTVKADDPLLTCRLDDGKEHHQPERIVIDTNLEIPEESALVKSAKTSKVTVIYGFFNPHTSDRREWLFHQGVETASFSLDEKHRINIKEVLEYLASIGIDSILVESGGELAASVLPFANEVHAYVAPKIFGGVSDIRVPIRGDGVDSPDDAVQFSLLGVEQFGDDVLLKYKRGAGGEV
ncbi:bifunctional diaminohydroxyphosphoribosylaminopyrimidine deaminase/5-amino-6-(5-phosphoribosylamino)uracil reductase RibD [Treponema saccharophilum]|uniref:Riboflavin biosynthesis protein RibD n=1 Tax=Treponema saccharophilum DSM 2985 TaxID=907348 RepID=H7EN17_9SPIR|nr:bifunctional diaminohydroxyphosphoribosylaminopyrimidine deaminase/5-amino-6-(5-phosphoribosylamino)uracil reductase RibD [Treponema saccharophilum]EIC01081.1 diaminohydroxyphosphoribosylaminopyrimidine deaminase [Treponema saccharophilum DSM 2985]BDC95393.1 riboflavin biosynthesis protein RibD [Treponema saccharophilum]